MRTRSRRKQRTSEEETPSRQNAATESTKTGSILDLNRAMGNQNLLGMIRAKLKVSRRDDVDEAEADRIAREITGSAAGPALGGGALPAEAIRASEKPPASAATNLPLGSGSQLDQQTSAEFGPRLGTDLDSVRVHTGSEANRTAEMMGARAFTIGNSVAFGPGEYSPGTLEGRQLIAHELAHVALGPSSNTLHRASPPELNYANLADRLYEATRGQLGTDEEQVYLALQVLNRDPDAITELSRVYLERHRESLESVIRDEFSGTELEYALQLLNLGTGGSAQRITAKPTTTAELEAAARRIRDAVEGLGTDEEAIYAVLLPFGRDVRALAELESTYQRLYDGEHLSARLEDEMSGSELDYALYLMGGPAIRANVEISEVSWDEARKLFSELARLNVWTDTNDLAPVPFHYPPDGCYDRAYVMEQRLTELGYSSRKVFAVSITSSGRGNLAVKSDYAQDVPAGSQPLVKWWYHVAPVIQVRTSTGALEEMVLDPSLADEPLKISQWTGLMGVAAFEYLPASEIRSLVSENNGAYPRGRNLVFTTDRDVYDPGRLGEGREPEEAARHHAESLPTITKYTRRAQVHELAAAIRRELRLVPISVDRIVAAILAATPYARANLWLQFPGLKAELESVVTDAGDRARISAALGSP